LLAVSAANVIPVVADVLTGGSLIKRAALGYDLLAGGRFYGIGNEYMGVVIGAAILGVAAVLELRPKLRRVLVPVIGVVFLVLILFFAAPFAGTNAGGALAAVVGFGVTLYRLSGGKFNIRALIVIALALAAGVGILIGLNNVLSTDTASHIGRAVGKLTGGDLPGVWQTIYRKLAANLYLLKNSPFSYILILQFVLVFVLLLRYRDILKILPEKHPYYMAGMTGVLAGALAAFTFNDSGVIAAALLLDYLIVPLIIYKYTWFLQKGPADE